MSLLATTLYDTGKQTGGGAIAALIFKTTLVAWIPAQIIFVITQGVSGGSNVPVLFEDPLQAIAGAVLLAPILETQAMRFMFHWLEKWAKDLRTLNVVSSLIWGAAHFDSGFGIPAVWAFFVMGVIYLRHRRQSVQRAVLITTAIHICFNALSYVVYLAIVAP